MNPSPQTSHLNRSPVCLLMCALRSFPWAKPKIEEKENI